MTTVINCEDEKIHLPNYIQDFGILVVFDQSYTAHYVSANSTLITKKDSTALLGINLFNFIETYFSDNHQDIKKNLEKVLHFKTIRTIQIKVETSDYYLSIYEHQQLIYFEFEKNHPFVNSQNFTNNYFDIIDQPNYIWDSLCVAIQSIFDYDRVMIYQFREDHSGKVIAEEIKPGLDSYLNFHYPEFDIPKQARALYTKKTFRMVPDVNSPIHPIFSKLQTPLDLSLSNIRALSPIHLEYLKNTKVQASCSISIMANGRLWGLVACQNETPKFLDLAARNQAIALTKYATNIYLSQRNSQNLKRSLILKGIELEVQSKSLLKNSLKDAIIDNFALLKKLFKANGIAFISNNEIFTDGLIPDKQQIRLINDRIANMQQEFLFSSSNFYEKINNELPYDANAAGVMWISTNPAQQESILWFRKEQQQEITWAGKPQKVMKPSGVSDVVQYSPRDSFQAWKETVKGSAFPWTDRDIFIAERLKNLAIESALIKMEEIKNLNNELKDLNNSLDSYAYTISHDLKNPLSVLKLNAQMILARPNVDQEFLKKRASIMLEGIDKMNNMITNILELSRSKNIEIELSLFNPKETILRIFDDCVKNHESHSCELILKNALPIYIEKTMQYQVFSNIISNAVKYSSKSPNPRVIIDSFLQDDYIVYTIEDNGIGIIPEEADKIFKIFYRLSNAKEFNGSGVGLSIVQQIMKRLQGSIAIRSGSKSGTIIELKFANRQQLQA